MSRFFALSRTTHGVLDMATPGFCALLWLGGFPAWQTVLLSLFTAFAAYTAIYALNDLLGVKCDREKFLGSRINPGYAVESSALRHPLARGLLSVRSGVIWTVAWFALALAGSYLLNPAIVAVLIVAAGLEVLYCRLIDVTYLKTLVSGLVKTSGPLSAVLVVDRSPSPVFLLLLMAWVFFWEIGGQNIPSDWNYTAEDQRAQAKTIPICLGLKTAGQLVMLALTITFVASGLLPFISPARLGWFYVLASLLLGHFLLLQPAYRLYRSKAWQLAARLFDRASYYPLGQLALISMFLVAEALVK